MVSFVFPLVFLFFFTLFSLSSSRASYCHTIGAIEFLEKKSTRKKAVGRNKDKNRKNTSEETEHLRESGEQEQEEENKKNLERKRRKISRSSSLL